MDFDRSLDDRIVAALRRIVRAVDLHSRRLVELHGLTGPQVALLRALDRLGPLAAGALAREVQLSQPTVTGIVSRLVQRGLVERARSAADRRSVVVEITAAGRVALARAPSLLQDRFRARLAGLESWEQTMLLAALQRVAAMMDASELGASPHLVPGADLAAGPVASPGVDDPVDATARGSE
ncbi:MAG: MarR family transcriptional regulator [Planctomycetes bacterium]|nr:MarR family transcriptional regulator [Planctomycetota bacterium]